MNTRKDLEARKDEIIALLETGMPRTQVCRLLDCQYNTLKRLLILWGVAHLKNQAGIGYKKPRKHKTPIENYLKIDGILIQTFKLKLLLWENGLKEKKCEQCSLSEWQGVPIPLELDHINGTKHDNRIENLRVLCPNCHALTPTYRGKNKKLKNEARMAEWHTQ